MSPRDVLVLSGGASRGAVQVGMLDVLLSYGVRPAAYVGTSVGALNAVFLACHPGYAGVARLAEHWRGIRAQDIFPGRAWNRLGHVVRHPTSLYPTTGLESLVRRWTDVARLEDLPVPVRVTTTRIDGGHASYHATYHDRGDLLGVLLASTALPGIFEPARLTEPDGTTSMHVDGGIADLVPVAGAAELAPDRVFVLDASVDAMRRKARTPLDVLLASLAVSMRVRPDIAFPPGVEVVHLTAPDLGVRMNDFSRTADHIALGRSCAEAVLGARLVA
ncbi:patatin-like phospholipase family protein [Nocardioides fonticola]|uniref:Patatin-like phospholipase family protein n=1 Tax=Nocardioides fonticola TaxID=450363 RepID=A0ABP7XH97_9ACTN